MSNKITYIDGSGFEDAVLKSKTPVIVDFFFGRVPSLRSPGPHF